VNPWQLIDDMTRRGGLTTLERLLP